MFPRVLIRFRRFSKSVGKRAFSSLRRYHWSNSEFENGVSLIHVKKALKLAGINHIDGHACIMIDCPVCVSDPVPDPKRKEHPRAFINKTTGFFVCDTCHHMGPWNIFEKFLVPKKTSKILKELAALTDSLPLKVSFQSQWEEIMKGCRVVSELAKEEYDEMIECLELTPVPQESLSSLNCAYDASAKTIHLPLIDSSNMISGYKSVTASSEATTPSSQAAGLIIYKQRSLKTEKSPLSTGTIRSAVIVPSVHDLLALVSQKAAQQIICLPHELKNLPQQVLPSLESYKKLTLWFDNDAPSWDTARNFAKKLDEKRCMFVRPTEKQPSPRIAVQKGLDLKNILQSAQPVWHKSITTFHSLRQDVLSDLQNIDRVQGVKWKRYPALNRILKGHRKGEFTVLTGPTGSGKTTFMSEYSLDLAMQGVNTLWGSFEIRNARLARTMLTQMAGLPLDVNLETFDAHADAFEKLPIYFMTFHGQQTIKVVMEAVEHATYVHDIAHVIIDNVQFMMGMGEESKHMDRFWKQDAIIDAFRTFATKFNCHVTLVIHPRKEKEADDLTTASIFGGAKASQEADNILIIQDKRLTSLRGKKYLQVAKNRYSGDLGVMTLEFDKASLSYAPKRKSKVDDESALPETEPAKNQSR